MPADHNGSENEANGNGKLEDDQSFPHGGGRKTVHQFPLEHDDGSERTEIFWTDGTTVTMTRTPDGKCSGGVVTKDGHTGNLPDAFFAEPIPDVVGGSLTALEKQSEKGIPGLNAETLERVGAGAKWPAERVSERGCSRHLACSVYLRID